MKFYGSKMVVAQFVNDIILNLEDDFLSTTITRQAKSGVYCVRIVTGTSSEDTVRALARIYSIALLSTSPKNTSGG